MEGEGDVFEEVFFWKRGEGKQGPSSCLCKIRFDFFPNSINDLELVRPPFFPEAVDPCSVPNF